jgi:hypothetical protein
MERGCKLGEPTDEQAMKMTRALIFGPKVVRPRRYLDSLAEVPGLIISGEYKLCVGIIAIASSSRRRIHRRRLDEVVPVF